ncbi:M56 family metallopeptidase [Lewinella sp. IMCC34191]|uniref:M56 family metallopeptidase n=1 Tax=Lewinella sp. IMCC34191 TaxID=2259172 RepID=UPI000E284812|nr:M56 family metallopeptidase [Lewinella sp. IMCC34191]
MVISDIAALGTTILHSLWQATLLAGVLWLVSRQRGLSARTRYSFAYATLVGQCLLSAATFLHYRSPSPHLEATVKQAVIEMVAAGPAVSTPRHLLYTPDFWMAALVSCWLVGMLVGSLKLSVSLWHLRRMQRTAVTDVPREFAQLVRYLANRIGYTGPLRLKTSSSVTTPMLIGHLKPILLFPIAMVNQLSTEESETVILHELAHLRRHDHWFNLLQCLIEVLFYYHPAIHWIGARIREEREHCCDDLVLYYGPGRLPYARALLHFSLAGAGEPAALSLTDGGGLLGRVRRFLDQQEISYKMKSRLLLLPVMAILVLVATAAYVPTDSSSNADAPSPDLSLPALAAQNTLSAGDTLPQGTHQMTRISDGKTTRLRVEDGEIKELQLDGREIPEEEFSQYEDRAEELLGVRRQGNDTFITVDPYTYEHDTTIVIGIGRHDAARFRRELGESRRKLGESRRALAESSRALAGSLQELDNFNFDFDFSDLQSDIHGLHIDLDSLGQSLRAIQIDAFDGDILLDADVELMDSVYTRSLNGMKIYRHRLEEIDDIDNLDELEAKEEVLQKALEQLEERKRQLGDRKEIRGEAMLEHARSVRERALAHARETREALQQRRHAPALQPDCPITVIGSGAVTNTQLAVASARSGAGVIEIGSRPCPPVQEVRSPEPIIYYEIGGDARPH